MQVLAKLSLQGPNDQEVPLVIAVHDRFRIRLAYYRSLVGVERAGFTRPDEGVPSGDWTPEQSVWAAANSFFKEGCLLIAVGRAEAGETVEQATEAILEHERRISK